MQSPERIIAAARNAVESGDTMLISTFDEAWGEFAENELGRVARVEGQTLVMRQQNAKVSFVRDGDKVLTRVALPSGTRTFERVEVTTKPRVGGVVLTCEEEEGGMASLETPSVEGVSRKRKPDTDHPTRS
jgi:hypothetical protein